MLSPLGNSTQNDGAIRVDLEVLDSLRKSWSIPKDTGRLIAPKEQKSDHIEKEGLHQQVESSNRIKP